MASFQIEWKRSALKELKRTPNKTTARIIKAVGRLADNPYPAGVRKLVSADYTYRIRVGDYRVVYSIYADRLVIEIVRIGHRKDIYR